MLKKDNNRMMNNPLTIVIMRSTALNILRQKQPHGSYKTCQNIQVKINANKL